MRTETLAVVFTDIKGYTAATSKQSHQEQAYMLRRIERLVAPVVRAFSGRVVKAIGDAYMIVFRSPTEAVRCASAVQDRLFQHNTNARADQGIHIRIAINVGEVRVHRGDVFGEPVNIASRIENVTPADEVYFSQAVYLTMNRSDVPTERVGDYEFKGIAEPVTVYRVKPFAAEVEEADDAEQRAAGLPYGGTDLGHWRKVRWVRRAYLGLWALAVVGLIGAAYIRYRPRTDYAEVVSSMKLAVEEGKAMHALALAGDIPESAIEERNRARRYRRRAVRLLLADGSAENVDTARLELDSLLDADPRDAEALMLRGFVQLENKPLAAAQSLAGALEMEPALVEQKEFVEAVVHCYAHPQARKIADRLVADHIKYRAILPLKRALADEIGDRAAHNTIANRMRKLGAEEEVDWVKLAIADLKSNSCKARRAAIVNLLKYHDPLKRAVGPLEQLANDRVCGSVPAGKAAEAIRKR
jgi:class 3 adenylate cyclase